MSEGVQRDDGLKAALEKVGLRHLARELGLHPSTVARWRRVPRAHLDLVARLSGLEPEAIRPDLKAEIDAEIQRRAIERARLVYGSAGDVARLKGAAEAAGEAGVPARVMRSFDLCVTHAALSFAASQFGVEAPALYSAPFGQGGSPSPAQRARAYGLALAVVVGRIEPTAAASLVGATKQNVQNIARRYLDARDGRDVSAGPPGGSEALWAAELKFLQGLAR